MSDPRAAFEQLVSANYQTIKGDVLTTLRGQLAADNMHVDPLDLEAAYNIAWQALAEQMEQDTGHITNLTGWLATVAYRRAIDEVRRSRGRLQTGHLALVEDDDASNGGCEPDIDAGLDDRDAYHQWQISVRLRLNAREQQAVGLCVQHSHKEASARMGISPNRLHKLMTSANKKLDGLLDVIKRGEWCDEQRSLITAYAYCLHEPHGERHQLAAAHLAVCPACAAYVRALRGIAAVVPPIGAAEALTAGSGGLLAGLSAVLKGSGGGAVAGGGALSFGGKTAAICATAACALGGAVVLSEQPADHQPKPKRAVVKQPAKKVTVAAPVAAKPFRARRRAASKAAARRAPAKRSNLPNPNSQAAQQISEFGPESSANDATSTPPARPTQPVQTGGASEFGPE